jgi:hypothetical protein
VAIHPLQLTVGGSVAVLDAGSLDMEDRLAARSPISFRVLDFAGTSHYGQGQPVLITDTVDGSTIFAGYVLTSKERRNSVLGGLTHTIKATDNVYLADKRLAIKTYSNALAGDIVSDLVASYLAAEGVTGQHLARVETTQADWLSVDATVGGGSLSASLQATAGGDLKLAQAGADVSRTETTTADFTGGTLTGVIAGSTGGGSLELQLGTNFSQVETSQADFNTGTLTTTIAESGGDLALNGYWNDWTGNVTTGQTLFGASSPTQSAASGVYSLGSAAANEAHSRFDNSPSLADFVCEFDAQIKGSGYATSLLFRTTNWANANGTWAYEVLVTTASVAWRRGQNSGTTTGTITSIASAVPSGLVSGNTYHVKVVMSGNNCQVTVNGTLLINATDSTFTSAGQFGLRFFNNGAGADSVTFDNFGVVASLTGTWQKDYDISGVKSASASSISWTATANGQTIAVDAAISTNSGGTYGGFSSCTSGSAIPVLNDTTVYTTVGRLRIRITLTASDAWHYFHLDDLTISVTAGYPLSGTHNRVWPSLDISPAVTVGSAIISWNATTPANTTLTVETSINGGSTYQTATSGAAISGLSAGTALAGISLLVRVTLATTHAGVAPVLLDLTVAVVSRYVAGPAARVSPGLSLAPLGMARSAIIAWTSATNGGTLLIETSVDGGVTWATASNGGSLAGLAYQSSDFIDGFDTDTSGQYALTGGAQFTWDTANSRLLAATGAATNAAMVAGATYTDVDVTAESDYADGGMLQVRRLDASNFYRLRFRDASGDATFTATALTLTKVVAGAATDLGTANVTWTRGDRHRLKLSAHGSALSVSFDDAVVISVTDSALTGAGAAGVASAGSGFAAGVVRFLSLIVQSGGTSLAGKALHVRQTLTAPGSRDASPVVSDITITAKSSFIEDGPTVTSATFGYAHVSDCVDKLAELASFWWNIDSSKRLLFRKRAALVAPRVIDGTVSSGSVLEDEDATEMETGNATYRNREYLTQGTDITSLQTEGFKGDGTTRSFLLRYPIARQPSSVTVNGAAKTVGIKGLDAGKDFYWSKGDNALAQDSAGTLLTSSDVGSVQYYGLFDTVYVAQDYGAVSTMQAAEGGGSTGYVEEADAVSGIDNSAALSQFAGAKLSRYAVAGKKLTFKTMVSGFASGQVALVYVPWHNLNGVQMLIESVKVQDVDGLRFWYDVTAVLGPYDDTWPAFWLALARKGSDGIDTVAVGQSGTLLVPVLFAESHAHGESFSVATPAAVFPATGLYPSTGLYPA